MTPTEIRRVKELIDEGYAAADPVQTIVRRIAGELPHLNNDDIAQVAIVHAEEMRLDADVLHAQAEASKRIAHIICEAGAANLGEVVDALTVRTAQGDDRAGKLLEEIKQALLIVSLGEIAEPQRGSNP